MRAILIILIFSANFLWLYKDDACRFYSPVLYAESDLDSLLVNSFVLFNHSGCDSVKVNDALSWIENQWPAFIVSTDIKLTNGFEWGQTLESSVLFCDMEATKFTARLFKNRLGRLGFDTTNVADKAYIDFHFSDFNYIPIVQCEMYKDVIYQDKIVIVGDMGESNISPVYNENPENYQVPKINGVDNIFGTQMLALILHSIIRKDLIRDAPFFLTLFCYVVIAFLTYLSFEIVFLKVQRPIVRYAYVKVSQMALVLGVFLVIFVVGPRLNYVFDSKLFNLPIIVGVEIIFWVYVLLSRFVNTR